jgi:ribose 5-phosphate isomerase A
MPEERSPAREAASAAAADLIEPGMTIGLGSGRAVWRVVERIAERWPDHPPLRAVVASELTHARARGAGIELIELDGTFELDLALDGADEVDPELRLIKGGGGALLREKVVAAASDRVSIIVDAGKWVPRLGRFPLPIEVLPFASAWVMRALAEAGGRPVLRVAADGTPFRTDQDNVIVDTAFGLMDDPDALAAVLSRLPGIVEHGLFIDLIDTLFIGRGGTVEVVRHEAARARSSD